jgi:hypothetical protein
MKQKDIALIAVIVFVSAVVSLIVSKTLFASPKHRQQAVEVVDPISANFPAPDSHYFNAQSIDPTKLIKIGDNSNPTPFNTKQ